MQQNDPIEKKILSYFYGDLHPEEEKALYEWINSNSENLAFFQKIKRGLSPDTIDNPLLSDSWIDLKNRIYLNQQFHKGGEKILRTFYQRFSRVAALFFLVTGLSFVIAWGMLHLQKASRDIVWFETTAPRGKKAKIHLPDGSQVWLNAETSISYPNNFTEGNRVIKLSGEAYFEVMKYNGMDFVVQTKDYAIQVLGTRFNVMAYEDFGRTETTLLEGKIKIRKDEEELDVVPGQKLTFREGVFSVDQKGTEKVHFWADDLFVFDQITFEELVKRLERWYDVDIEIKNEELKQVVYSGVFKNEETIFQVLNSIKVILPFEYIRTNDRRFEIRIKK